MISVCLVAAVRSAWASDTDVSISATDWLQGDYEPLKSLKTIPKAVLNALLLRMPNDSGLADQTEKFNATDVINPGLPMRRFVFGGKNTRFVLIGYEHGGRGHHYHIAVFSVVNESPELIFAGRSSQRIKTIDEIKELVREGKVMNEIKAKNQEW